MVKKYRYRPFHSTREELAQHNQSVNSHLAFADLNFMTREELRPVRIQLELLRPELTLQDHGIENTIVVFGSARIPWPEKAQKELEQAQQFATENPQDKDATRRVTIAKNRLANSHYLLEAEKLAKVISEDANNDYVVVTGGGPSFMEAANKGAASANQPSIALGIMLPNEQAANRYVTPELTFEFHYFAIRKMHFLMRARALVAFPGGFGTLDELFESLTLLQTEKMERIPLLLFNKKFWDSFINFEALVDNGTIDAKDLDFIQFVETADDAWDCIKRFYANP
jgi:uncharacterized protein (TIGR00730 family)